MAFPHVGKIVASLGFVGSFVLVAACGDYHDHDRYRNNDDCDYVERQCQQVCDYYCDYYSCYPTCYDQCWDDCGHYPRRPSSSSSSSGAVITDGGISTPPSDASSPPPVTDAGTGTGVLCSSCLSNADCEKDALCILRGGPPRDAGTDGGGPAGRGFCGAFCSTSDNCPQGFLCSQIGQSRQCLPTGNACE